MAGQLAPGSEGGGLSESTRGTAAGTAEASVAVGRVVAIHQPNYVPWLGYFHKIARCDVFVFLDDAQFSKNSFINRNRIKTAQGVRWLTIPVHGSIARTIAETRIASGSWRDRHAKTLQSAYGAGAHFKTTFPWIEAMLTGDRTEGLAEFNVRVAVSVCERLGLRAEFCRSSHLDVGGQGDDRLVGLVKVVRGTGYLSGRGAARYQDPDKFARAGLGFAYSDFRPPVYPQVWGAFMPGLSVLDALFNVGVDGTRLLLEGRVGRDHQP